MGKFFKENGDDTPPKQFHIAVPMNIRFSFYNTREEIKLENIFAALPITIPVTDSIESGLSEVKKIMTGLKSAMPLVYCMYLCMLFASSIMPKTFPRRVVDN